MMLAAAYRSASTQIQDQKDQFNAVFDKALRQQSDAFDDLSWADVKAQKTAILASISEEVEIEIRVLGIDWSWSIETPNLEQGVNCVVQKARGFETHPLLSSFPELGRSSLTPDSFNQLELLLVDQGLATKENVDCEACSQFAGLAEEVQITCLVAGRIDVAQEQLQRVGECQRECGPGKAVACVQNLKEDWAFCHDLCEVRCAMPWSQMMRWTLTTNG